VSLDAVAQQRGRWVWWLALASAAAFAMLGAWQIERLKWKRALIDRVQRHVSANPAPAPARSEWPALNAERYEYLHVSATGTFANDRETLVQAVTEQGPGFWVLTPLYTEDRFTVLVNRGFVPLERAARPGHQAGDITGTTTITGLLRLSEPRGAFLRTNSPEADRWYSRDVEAIARQRKVTDPAPYFIDADGSPNAGGVPIGGLTVITFRNQHLQYAVTWFGLALLSLAYGVAGLRWQPSIEPRS
jgi:surfeit locus 1 family protein